MGPVGGLPGSPAWKKSYVDKRRVISHEWSQEDIARRSGRRWGPDTGGWKMPTVLTVQQLSQEALPAIVNVAISLRQREMPVAHWAQPGHSLLLRTREVPTGGYYDGHTPPGLALARWAASRSSECPPDPAQRERGFSRPKDLFCTIWILAYSPQEEDPYKQRCLLSFFLKLFSINRGSLKGNVKKGHFNSPSTQVKVFLIL